MIPISDDNPTRLTPIMTWALIALCVIVYLWERSLPGSLLGCKMDGAIRALGFTPASLFGQRVVVPSGCRSFPAVETIFTSMFLHGSILHIAGNMLYLWIFGNNVEDAMGHVRFVFFYLLCGVAAALTFAYAGPDPSIPMVGASGAISGVLAAYVLLFPRARVTVIVPLGIIFYPLTVSAFWVVGFWFVLQLASAALSGYSEPGVAWWAHVGGFAAGLLLTPVLKSSDFPLFGNVRRRGPWER
jgi:membrane associated rhomboid family serine protease